MFLFLHTNDFWRDYKVMQQQGVKFNEQPREEAYGTVVVFEVIPKPPQDASFSWN